LISATDREIYLLAVKDIRAILLGPCPVDIVEFLAQDGTNTRLRRWAFDDPPEWADLNVDFQAILLGLDKAVDAFPDNPWTRAMRGRAAVAIRYYPAAFFDYEVALGAFPDHAFLNTLAGEAHFFHAAHTLEEPLDCYLMAIYHLSHAICMDIHDPRPYISRAQARARAMHICGYHRYSGLFAARFREITDDLDAARKLTDRSKHGSINAMEQRIKSLLDL